MRTIVMKSILIDHFIKDVKREIVFKVPSYITSVLVGAMDTFCLLLVEGRGPKRLNNVLTAYAIKSDKSQSLSHSCNHHPDLKLRFFALG